MEEKEMYGEMVFYIEACESGSMFPKLKEDQNVYAMTASNATTSSWAAYCSPENVIDGVSIGSCLGDEFSVNWMEDSESNNPFIETLAVQHETVKAKTIGSPVQTFGDFDFQDETIGMWEGNSDGNETYIQKSLAYFNLNAVNSVLGPVGSKSLINSRDVKMHYLTDRASRNGGVDAHSELMAEIQLRMNADSVFKNVFPHHATMNEELVVVPQNFDCLRYLMSVHDEHCGRFDDYSLKYVKHLVHTCET